MSNFLNLYTIPPLVSSLAFLALGIFVFLKNKKESINKTFLYVCLATFWWQFSWFILFGANDEITASYMVMVGYVGIIFIPITFYHFFVNLIGKEKTTEKWFVYFSYGAGLVFLYLFFMTHYLIN